jgi:hypothetical protein
MNISMAWQTMRASMLSHMGKAIAVTYIFFLLISALIMSVSLFATGVEKEKYLLFGTIFSSLPTYLFWSVISSRSLKVLRDTDNMLIPSVPKALFSSLILQYLLTVLVPSILLGLFSGYFLFTLGIFSLFAVLALLATLIPPFLGVPLGFLPYCSLFFIQQLSKPDSTMFIPGLYIGSIAVIFICTLRLYQLRRVDNEFDVWRSPSALMPSTGNGWSMFSFNLSKYESKQSKASAAHIESIISSTTTKGPELTLRIWMGQAFMPNTLSVKIRNVTLISAAFFGLPWLIMFNLNVAIASRLNQMAAASLVLISFGFLMLALVPKLFRLHSLYKNNSAELSELPLIPAWSSLTILRNLIKQIILKDIGKAFLISIIFSTLCIFSIKPDNFDIYAANFILNSCSALLAIGYAMRTVTRQKRRGLIIGLAYYFIPTASIIFSLIASIESISVFLKSANYMLWFICGLVCIIYLAKSHRKFQSLRTPLIQT